jgi:hypothetical protein
VNACQRYLLRLSPKAAVTVLLTPLAIAIILVLLSAPRQGDGAAAGNTGAGAGGGAAPTATLITTEMQGSYAVGYQSIGQLKADADLVALGTVTGVTSVQYVAAEGRVWTTYSVRMDEVLGGKQRASIHAGQALALYQIGGTAQGQQTRNTDDPQMVVGQRAYLFLRYAAADASLPAGYVTLGGGQGRFILAGGNVHQVLPTRAIPDAGTTEANFRAAIARA